MITIPIEFKAQLIFAVKSSIMSLEMILSLDEEGLLKLMAQSQENEHIRAMLESKKFEDILQDIEIREMMTGFEISMKDDHANMVSLLDEIEKQ